MIIPAKKSLHFPTYLNHDQFPLAEILDNLLQLGQKAMNNPVEIEFAVDLDITRNSPVIFNLLQIRPIVINEQSLNFRIDNINPDEVIIYSEKALGQWGL